MQIGFQSTTAQRAVWGFRAVSGPFNRWTYACRPQKRAGMISSYSGQLVQREVWRAAFKEKGIYTYLLV